jgi:hypothetical protein
VLRASVGEHQRATHERRRQVSEYASGSVPQRDVRGDDIEME